MFDTDKSTAMPFCSPRCKQVDLGRWLGEKYSVPYERTEEDEEEEYPPRGRPGDED
jgi:endogenous inhibitor of DNA gyrase (YacG/DUF329 family)